MNSVVIWSPHKKAEILVNGRPVPYQVRAVTAQIKKLQTGHYGGIGTHELIFKADLPGMHTTIAKISVTEKTEFNRKLRDIYKRRTRGLNPKSHRIRKIRVGRNGKNIFHFLTRNFFNIKISDFSHEIFEKIVLKTRVKKTVLKNVLKTVLQNLLKTRVKNRVKKFVLTLIVTGFLKQNVTNRG